METLYLLPAFFMRQTVFCFATALLTACAIHLPATILFPWSEHQFSVQPIQTSTFTVYSAQKITRTGDTVIIYIEGDGRAWLSRNRISADPTPVSSLVRSWAIRDSRANVVYLARPCQYIATFQPPCTSDDWASKRLSTDIITSLNQAIDQIKRSAQAKQIELIGYSGGGGAAVLIAARRYDVTAIITVAGNLDTNLFATLQHVSPLDGSLNPRDVAPQLGLVKQIHYTGGQDKTVPIDVTQSFMAALPIEHRASIVIVPSATHADGWDRINFTKPYLNEITNK